MRNKVLFISHEATLTGAPIILQQVVRFAVEHGVEAHVVIVNRKEKNFLEEFKAHAKTVILAWEARDEDYPEGIDLIYSNTITNGQFVESLDYPNIPVITHVHELTDSIIYYGQANVEAVLNQTDCFITCSNSTMLHLHNNFGVFEDSIVTVPSFVDFESVDERAVECISDETIASIFQEDRFVVLSCGWASQRKGTDLFIKTAESIPQYIKGREVHFVWVGGNTDSYTHALELGIQQRIHFTGPLKNPFPLYEKSDIFLLTSREDPFPLVMLESAGLGKPVLGFTGSGGVDDLASLGAAKLVAPLDATKLAAEVTLLLSRGKMRKKLGEKSKKIVRERFSKSVCLEQILSSINSGIIKKPGNINYRENGESIWLNNNKAITNGKICVFYGRTAKDCKCIGFDRTGLVRMQIEVPYVDVVRFDPDYIPGLFTFKKFKIIGEEGEVLFDWAELDHRSKLSYGGTCKLFGDSEALQIISNGNDPQIFVNIEEHDENHKRIKIIFDMNFDNISDKYSKRLNEMIEIDR